MPGLSIALSIVLFCIQIVLFIITFIFRVLLFFVIHVLALDYVVLTGLVAWLAHTNLGLNIFLSLLVGFLVATFALALTRIKYVGIILTIAYSAVYAVIFYLWLDDFWNCDNQTQKMVTELICSAVIIIWHFISLRIEGDAYFGGIAELLYPVTDTFDKFVNFIRGKITKSSNLIDLEYEYDENEEPEEPEPEAESNTNNILDNSDFAERENIFEVK